MKLTIFLLTAAFLNVSASGLSQQVTFSGKNVPLEKVFAAVKKQTGFVFLYTNDILKDAKPVSLDVHDEPLELFLKRLFAGQPIKYTLSVKSVLLARNTNAAPPGADQQPVLPAGALGDQLLPQPVTGRITDASGNPLAGATVSIRGKNKTVTTDAKGEFNVEAEPGDVLLISYVGYQSSTYRIAKGTTFITASLVAAVNSLDSVAVTYSTGYQQIAPERTTGSFSFVDNALVNRGVSGNIIDRIQNVTNGLKVYNGQLSVRGESTLFANRNPLIVIDNFPYDGNIENINPNDIQDITVLKDAAAASIWGAFSGNGVIVITTKKAKLNNPLTLSFVTSQSRGEKPDLFANKNYMNSADMIEVQQMLFNNGFYDANLANVSTYPYIAPAVEIMAMEKAGTLTTAQAQERLDVLRNHDVRDELSRYYYRQSQQQQYALNLKAGNSKAAFMFSAGYDKSLSSLVANDQSRVTLNTSATVHPVKNLELMGAINYINFRSSQDNSLSALTGSTMEFLPYTRLADENGQPLVVPRTYRQSFTDAAQDKGLLNWKYMPLNEIGLTDNKTMGQEVRLNTAIRYTIVKGLQAQLLYQYQNIQSDNTILYSPETYFTRDIINNYSSVSGTTVTRNIPEGSILTNSSNSIISNAGRVTLNYSNNISYKGSLQAIAGFEVKEAKANGNGSGLYGYDVNSGTYANVNYATNVTKYPLGSGLIPNNILLTGTLNRFRSGFANAAYSYDRRYSVSASVRMDQTNLFGYKTNNKTLPLWSVGGKWNVKNERFFHSDLFQQLAIRATYGLNGNFDARSSPLTIAQSATVVSPANLPYSIINRPGNPQLSWEKIATFNVGVDFILAKNILYGSIDYFRKTGTDLIADDPLDPTTGFESATGNFADIKGKGLDLILNADIVNRDFKWKSTFMLAYYNNEVTRYKGSSRAASVLEGRPIAGLYAYEFTGLDPADGSPIGNLKGASTKDYAAIVNSTLKDMVYVGSLIPLYTGSFINTFTYKGITLTGNISYRAGHHFLKQTVGYYSLFNSSTGNSDYALRWKKAGDEKNTTVPSLIYPAVQARDAFYAGSTANVEKGDVVRFDDIRISYSLPASCLKRIRMKSIEVFGYIENLGVLWAANKYGVDPNNYTGSGIIGSAYLPPRNYSLGLRAEF